MRSLAEVMPLRELTGPMLARGAGAALALGFHVLLARMTDPAVVGRYALAFVLIWLLAMIGRMGLDGVLARQTARVEDQGSSGGVLWLQVTIAVPALAGSAVMAGIAYLSADLLGLVFHSSDLPLYVRVMAIGLVPLSATLLIAETFRGLGRHSLYVFFSTVCLNLLLVAALMAFSLSGNLRGAVPWVFVAAAASSALCGGALIAYVLSSGREGAPPKPAVPGYRALAAEGWPLLAAGVLELSLQAAGLIVLALFGTDEDVGVLRIVLRTAMVVAFVIFVVNGVVSRRIARLYDTNDLPEIVALCRRMTLVSATLGLPLCAAMLLVPQTILLVFGHEFVSGSGALRIVAASFAVALVTGPTATALIMTGHGRLHRNITAVAAITNITGNLILVPFFGLVGSAFAFLVATLLQAALSTLSVRRIFGASFIPPLSAWRNSSPAA